MSESASVSERSLRIVHILRSPVGGLFRHVLDLVEAQNARGHHVGLIADATTGGTHAETVLAAIAPRLALGLTRLPMNRDPHPADLRAGQAIRRLLKDSQPDIVHGHGAKGGLYARWPGLPGRDGRRPVRAYTPHGGSLHYDPASLKGALVLGVERWLARRTDLLLFESSFAAERFRAAVTDPDCLTRIVHNGLRTAEFTRIAPAADAADFLFVGELRLLKGVDLMITALAALRQRLGRPVRAALVGAGPDRAQFEAQVETLGLTEDVRFLGPMPARDAFALGSVLVVPSRAESLPYIVLEAAAAQVPVIATRVGGIPEIFGGADSRLVSPDDAEALATAMAERITESPERRAADALALSRFVETRFTTESMADDVIAAYREALAASRGASRGRLAPRQLRRPMAGLKDIHP